MATTLKAFRFPTDLAKKLARISKKTHRSEKFYVTQALEHYFAEYADAQIAKDRFEDPKARILSSKELKKRVGL